MDQILSVFGIDWRLLLVQILNFGLLLGILWHFLYKPLTKMMAERQQLIVKGVEDAATAERRLSEVEAERGTLLSTATREAEGIVESAKQHAEEKERQILSDAAARSERLLKDAEAQAEEAKRRAIAESREEVAKMAVLAAEKVLRAR